MQSEPQPLAEPAPPPPPRASALLRESEAAQVRIAAVLHATRRRALLLASARGVFFGLAVLLLAGLVGALAASLASALVARAVAGLLVILGLLAIGLWSWRSPLQRAALLSRTPASVARLLGRGDPEGGSDLLSSVELSRAGAPGLPGVSPELLALLHIRAAVRAEKIDATRALPSSSVRRPALLLLASVLIAGLATLVAPRRLSLGLSRLLLGDAALPAAELSPIAGDLSLTYLYPAYTGLPPRTEEGTAGDLHAPKGTQVRITARADRDLDSAFAVLNGAAVKLTAEGPGHRQLSGTVTLQQAGSWRLRYADERGRTMAEGPPRPIELQPDSPPQVAIDEPRKAELEVDPQGRVDVQWTAGDDYGLSQVSLVLQPAGGKEERRVLKSPGANVKRLRGSYVWELATHRLRAGDKIAYFIEAKDNNGVDGPQRGVSATQVIKVFSAAEHHKEALLRAQALWERLVALLADRLEEKPPPAGPPEGDAWFQRTSAKDGDALQLAADLSKAGVALVKDKLAPQPVARALKYAASGLSEAAQRTQLTRARLSHGLQNYQNADRGLQNALKQEIAEEEKDVLYLEDLLDQARLADMAELGKELAASRRELARLAEKLRKAPDESTKKELLAEVSRLRERINDLLQRMSELARGIRDEHLNEEAVKTAQEEKDLMAQLDDIQRKLQGDKIDEALKQLDQLGKQLEQLEQSLQKKGQQSGGERYAQEAKELREAADQLSKIQKSEQELEKKTADLRRALREKAQKRFEAKGGKELGKKLREKATLAKKQVAQIEKKVAEQLGLDDVLDAAEGRVTDLERALQLGDFDEALDLAERATRSVEAIQGRLSAEQDLSRRYPGFMRDPQGVDKSLKGAQGAQKPLREILSQLQDALPREGEGMSGQQMKELRDQQGQQRALREQLGQAREKLAQVGKKVPIFGPQHERMLQEAQQGMGEAEDRLGRGEPRGAQAGETQAIEKLQQFEKAMKQMAQQQGGKSGEGGIPMPWGEPQGGQGEESGEGNDEVSHEKVEIPDAEAGRGPAEFRKELLDAMKQAAPEKYKERVRQYYEELVK